MVTDLKHDEPWTQFRLAKTSWDKTGQEDCGTGQVGVAEPEPHTWMYGGYSLHT